MRSELASQNPERISRKTETIGRFQKITVGGVVGPERHPSATIGQQTLQVLDGIQSALQNVENAGKEYIYRSNISIRNPAAFATLNTVYGAWFQGYDNPTRFTTVKKFDNPNTLVQINCMMLVPNEPGAEVILEDISTPNAPAAVGPYAQGKRINFDIDTGDEMRETVITSGQIALIPNAEKPTLVSPDFGEQTTQTFANVQAILEAGGTENVSGVDVVLTDEKNREAFLAKYNEWATEYDKTLPEPNIIVGDLLLGALIEVSAVGKRDKTHDATVFDRNA